jgi:hypothetical protein
MQEMVGKWSNPIQWFLGHVPRNQAQLETELWAILKVVFWVAPLAPGREIPDYHLVLALMR